MTGRLYRVVTSSGGVETWHDHYIFYDSYLLPAGDTVTTLVVVTSSSDPDSNNFGPHPYLKDFLSDMKGAEPSGSPWDYAQIHYTWSNMPSSAPTGCPPS